jgi:hypothetical protein
MRRSVNIYNLVALLVVISTGFTGMVFALWSDTVEVSGTVTTAEFDTVWFFKSCDEFDGDEKLREDEIVTDVVEPTADQKSINVSISNAFPGYKLYCEIQVANTGDVPVRIRDIITATSHPDALLVSAIEIPEEAGKVLDSCGFVPEWGTRPAGVPAGCRQEIQLTVVVLSDFSGSATIGLDVTVEIGV